jgi:hypothetical protein
MRLYHHHTRLDRWDLLSFVMNGLGGQAGTTLDGSAAMNRTHSAAGRDALHRPCPRESPGRVGWHCRPPAVACESRNVVAAVALVCGVPCVGPVPVGNG